VCAEVVKCFAQGTSLEQPLAHRVFAGHLQARHRDRLSFDWLWNYDHAIDVGLYGLDIGPHHLVAIAQLVEHIGDYRRVEFLKQPVKKGRLARQVQRPSELCRSRIRVPWSWSKCHDVPP